MGCNDSVSLLYRLSVLQFQFMRPRWAQLQDLDSILLSILYFVYKHHFFIQSYLIITSVFYSFSASLPVFLCVLITRTLHLIRQSQQTMPDFLVILQSLVPRHFVLPSFHVPLFLPVFYNRKLPVCYNPDNFPR